MDIDIRGGRRGENGDREGECGGRGEIVGIDRRRSGVGGGESE